MTSSRKISTRLVKAFGFSKGCDEFALKYPPPFVPSSLIASCEATSPPWITWCPPDSVVTVVGSVRFWMTPPSSSTTAPTRAIGTMTRNRPRTRSTQKLPRAAPLERTRPRTRATATARPTAGETKFWTVRPTVCTNGDVPASPAYDCQLVFVTNETAVLTAVSTFIAALRARGSTPWSTRTRKSSTIPTTENATTATAYVVQRCSDVGSTRTRR